MNYPMILDTLIEFNYIERAKYCMKGVQRQIEYFIYLLPCIQVVEARYVLKQGEFCSLRGDFGLRAPHVTNLAN